MLPCLISEQPYEVDGAGIIILIFQMRTHSKNQSWYWKSAPYLVSRMPPYIMPHFVFTECYHLHLILIPPRKAMHVSVHSHAYFIFFSSLVYLFSLIQGRLNLLFQWYQFPQTFLIHPTEGSHVGNLNYGGSIMRFEMQLCGREMRSSL